MGMPTSIGNRVSIAARHTRIGTLKKANLTGSFESEALEQRVLLSADPVLSGVAPSAEEDLFSVSETLDETGETSENSLAGAEADDLFSDVVGEGLDDSNSLNGDSDGVIVPADEGQGDEITEDAGSVGNNESTADAGLLDESVSDDASADDLIESDVDSISGQLLDSLAAANGPPNAENSSISNVLDNEEPHEGSLLSFFAGGETGDFGDEAVVIGSEEGTQIVHVGDESSDEEEEARVDDDIVILTPEEGGHVYQWIPIVGSASYTVNGSGSTYDLMADITMAGNVTLNDAVIVMGFGRSTRRRGT